MREESASRLPEDRSRARAVSWIAHPMLHLGLNAVLVTVSELLLKKGALSTATGTPSWLSETGLAALGSGWVVAGIVCYLISYVNWLFVLRAIPIHIAYPVSNLSHALIPLAAWIWLGERFGPTRALGIALIIVGTWFVARPAAREAGPS